MVKATYDIRIDRDGDGSFEASEELSSDVRAVPGLSIRRGSNIAVPLAPPQAGRADLDLGNDPDHGNGQYSPGGTKEVLLSDVVQVKATDPADSTEYALFTGPISRVTDRPEIQRQAVELEADDELVRIVGARRVATQLYENITVDVALGHLLDAIDWASGARALDTAKTTLKWWWLDDSMDVFKELLALLNSEGPGARIYLAGDGDLVFKNRHARVLETRSTTTQVTFRGDGTEPLHSAPFAYEDGQDDVINSARMTVRTRSAKTIGAIWSLEETLTLAAGETRSFVVEALVERERVPFTGAQTPVLNTDYTLDAGTLSSVTLNRTSGGQATLSLTAGNQGAVVASGLQVRAQLVSVDTQVVVETTLDTSASQTQHGLKVWDFDRNPIRHEVDLNTAQDWVNAVPAWYQRGRERIAPMRVAASQHADRMTAALSLEIGDRIAVHADRMGLAGSAFWVEAVEHRVTEGPQHEWLCYAERADDATYFVLDTSELVASESSDGDALAW